MDAATTPPQDRAAFDDLLAAAWPRARAVVARLIGHPEDTDDILQAASVKAWQGLADFRGDAAFATWFTAIAARAAIDHLRAAKRWRREAQVAYANLCAESDDLGGEVMAAFADPEFSFEVREHIAYCFSCVGRSLPPDEQAALVLRDVLDMSTREAANVLGLTESVLRHRLTTARQAMTAQFDGLCALVNKAGICHQCTGLSAIANRDTPLPDVAELADRMAVVRDVAADPTACRTKALHDVFWRRTKHIEDNGLGTTEPMSACGTAGGPASGPEGEGA